MDETEIKGELTAECGHHCGIQVVGKARFVGHCICPECHNLKGE